jgi:hypothetical protein
MTWLLKPSVLINKINDRRLPDASLQEQVTVALEPNAGLQEALKRVTLPAKAVNNISTWERALV